MRLLKVTVAERGWWELVFRGHFGPKDHSQGFD